MDYFELSKLLEESFNEIKEPVDDSSIIAGWSSKVFNQGAQMLMHKVLLKCAEKQSSEVTAK